MKRLSLRAAACATLVLAAGLAGCVPAALVGGAVGAGALLMTADRRSGETVRRDGGAYVGVEGRTALRYEPAGIPGLSGEAGAQAALRLPSSIQAFDLGLVLEAGWRF